MNTFNETRRGRAAPPAPVAPVAGRAARKAETASRVLEAARDEFETRGFEAASVRLIAARARVSVGTVLHHYGDKRQLLYAALHAALEDGIRASLAASGKGPLEAQLLRVARGVLAVYEARPALSRTLLRESLFADGEWGARFVAQTAAVHGEVCELARAAVARGELPADADAEAIALAFVAFFDFALLAWMQSAPLPRGPLGMIERLLATLLGGARRPGSGRPAARAAEGRQGRPRGSARDGTTQGETPASPRDRSKKGARRAGRTPR